MNMKDMPGIATLSDQSKNSSGIGNADVMQQFLSKGFIHEDDQKHMEEIFKNNENKERFEIMKIKNEYSWEIFKKCGKYLINKYPQGVIGLVTEDGYFTVYLLK